MGGGHFMVGVPGILDVRHAKLLGGFADIRNFSQLQAQFFFNFYTQWGELAWDDAMTLVQTNWFPNQSVLACATLGTLIMPHLKVIIEMVYNIKSLVAPTVTQNYT